MENTRMQSDSNSSGQDNSVRAEIVSTNEFKKALANTQEGQKKKINTLKNIAFMAGGVGVAHLAMGFMPSRPEEFNEEAPVVVPDEPQIAQDVNNNMSFEEAWSSAREEVGAGGYFVWKNETFSTYTKEEWTAMDEESQNSFNESVETMHEDTAGFEPLETPVVVYDEAPVSDIVTDDMSFDDAFALARQDLGPGGVFTWQGNTYNTYYKDEWNKMDDDEQNQFMSSTSHIQVDETQNYETLSTSQVKYSPEAEAIDNDGAEEFLGKETVALQDGTQVNVGYFMSNGETITKMDVNMDDSYDYIVDPAANQLIGLNGNQDVDLNTVSGDANASGEDSTNKNAVMSEEIKIDGHNALVTTYSDGSEVAQIDMDGDGKFDTQVMVEKNGMMSVYDNQGNLLKQEQLPPADDTAPDLMASQQQDIGTEDEQELYAGGDVDEDFVDDQLADNYGNDFDDNADVSGWMNDELA